LEDNLIELSVTLPAQDVDAAVKAAYAEAAKNRIKGFRVGKAPRNVLDKVFGGPEYFLAEATDEIIKASYLKAIDSHDMVPLDSPDLGEVEPAVEGQDYEYSFSFTIAPEYQLSSYEPLVIEMPSEEPTPEEVQSRVDSMMSYYVEYVAVEDRPSQVGDILTLDMEVTQDDERVESLSGEGVPYELGADAMPDGFEENFIGIWPGAEISVDFTLPYYDGAEDGEEQDLHAESKLLKIEERKIPELTDEWVKEKLEYESADHFRELLADNLRAQKQASMPELKERRVAHAIGQRLVGEPPALIVSDFSQDIYRDIFNSLQNQGVTLDVFLASTNQTPDGFREDVQEQATNNARQAMALDAWARHADITASDEDIRTEFAESGVDDPDALYEQWLDVGRISEIRQGIRRMKASRQLNAEAIVTEEAAKPAVPVVKDGESGASRSETLVVPDALIIPNTASGPESLILPDSLVVPETLILPASAQVAKDLANDEAAAKDEAKKARKADADTKASGKADAGKSKRQAGTPQAQRRTGGPKKV
jgi:trigger factor